MQAAGSLASSVAYMVVIDGGSSGSRAHVFRMMWRTGVGEESGEGQALPEIAHSHEVPEIELPSKKLKVEPGLSTYVGDTGAAGASLLPLIEFAKAHVPEDAWPVTPLILAATAGLRMLPSVIAAEILASCARTLREHAPFRIEDRDILVLSGADEGIYGWLSINFLAQRLRGMKHAAHGTLGALEVGGASMLVEP